MFQTYIHKLIENLPNTLNNKKKILTLDLILDGGVFNGSYLIGALYFLKEMENRKYIKIDRISGCSIGSICALLYFINELDMVTEIYSILTNDLRENHHLNKLKEIGILLKDKLPEDICEKIKDKINICFYNLKTKKKIIKSTFLSKDELIDVIIRSCFVPFLIDGSLCYKNKYMDGMNPTLFKKEKMNSKNERRNKKKTLYLDLFGYDKLFYLFNVKNEKTNFHRILSGLLDVHNFFIKNSSTPMCSYVENWSITHWLHHYKKKVIEFCFLHIITLFFLFKNFLNKERMDCFFFRFLSKIFYEFYILFLDTYFL
jgi:hypothetical protein